MSQLLDLVNAGEQASPIELSGSELTKHGLAGRAHQDNLMLCAVSDISDEDAMDELFVTFIYCFYGTQFISDLGVPHLHAVLIDETGKPLTMGDLRSAM